MRKLAILGWLVIGEFAAKLNKMKHFELPLFRHALVAFATEGNPAWIYLMINGKRGK
jgi:hypothetical protein